MSARREAGAVPPWVMPEAISSKGSNENINPNRRQRSSGDNFPPWGETAPRQLPSPQKKEDVQASVTTPRRCNLAAGDDTSLSEQDSKKEYLLISGGQVVNGDHMQTADVLIADGKIESVGVGIRVKKGTPTIDATELMIFPGGVDIATYIENDRFGFDPKTFLNTTKEALLGGTTTIVDTVICPKGHLPLNTIREIQSKTKGTKLWCNVVYRVGLLEISETILSQMETLVKQKLVNSFLFFVSGSASPAEQSEALSPVELRKAMEKCHQLGVLAVVRTSSKPSSGEVAVEHSEDQEKAEIKATEEILAIAEMTNCPVIISSPHSLNTVEMAAQGRRQFPPIHAYISCAPSVLLPTPLNGMQKPSKFLDYLTTGGITAVSSDQAGTNPYTGSPRLGAIGQRLVAVWESGVPPGYLDASLFVNLTSANAARYSGLYPSKGRVSPGADADLILWPICSLARVGSGRPTMVLLNGKVMAREGKLADSANELIPPITVNNSPVADTDPNPEGDYLAAEPFPSAVYGLVAATDRMKRRHLPNRDSETFSTPSPNAPKADTNLSIPQAAPAKAESRKSPGSEVSQNTPTARNQSGSDSSHMSVRMVHGHRDLYASGFSLSGAQVDDDKPQRSGIRTSQPPGGASRNPLW